MKKAILLLFIFISFFSSKAATYYWVGNSGNWNDYSNHWATTSGGSVFYNQPPTANDDVVFDANSFSIAGQMVDIGSGSYFCKNLNWNNLPFHAVFGNPVNNLGISLNIYGSLNIDRSMEFAMYGALSFQSSGVETINCKLISPIRDLRFENASGTWNLLDSLLTNSIKITGGTVNTNGHYISAQGLTDGIGGNKVLSLGTSTLEITNWDTWSNHQTDLTVDADQASLYTHYYLAGEQTNFHKLVLNNDAFSTCAFIGDDCHYDSVLVQSGRVLDMAGVGTTIGYFKSDIESNVYTSCSFGYAEFTQNVNADESNSFDTLALYNNGYITRFNEGKTQNIASAILSNPDPCAGFITIQSYLTGSQAIIHSNAPGFSIYNAAIQDIAVTGTVVFNAIASINNGNVNGCNFTSSTPRTLYWVGGSGNSDDAIHWSLTSGGAGGVCAPGQVDSVVFDANSLNPGNNTFTVHNGTFTCKSFNAAGISQTLNITGTSISDAFNVYGGFAVSADVNWNYNGELFFKAVGANNQVLTNGVYMDSITFSGQGSWILQDSLRGGEFTFEQGTLNTNNQVVRANNILSQYATLPVTVNLGTSTVFCNTWQFTITNTTHVNGLMATLKTKEIRNNGTFDIGTLEMHSDPFDYARIMGNDVSIGKLESFSVLYCIVDNLNIGEVRAHDLCVFGGNSGQLGNVHFEGDFDFAENVSVDSLFLENPGFQGKIHNTLTVDVIESTYTACDPYSKMSGGTLFVSSGSVDISNLVLENTTATGGASFNAINSLDYGNVAGWNFSGSVSNSTFYWIGGSGNWSDGAHWSYTSGGTPANCSPTPLSDVFFDENSFSGNDIVSTDISGINCHNLTWHNLTTHPTLKIVNADNNYCFMNVSGNLELDNHMLFQYTTPLVFNGTGLSTIKSNGISITNMKIDGTHPYEVLMLDSLSASIEQGVGTLNTNNFPLSGYNLNANDTVKLGNSTVDISSILCNSASNAFLAGNALIRSYSFACNSDQDINKLTITVNGFLAGSGFSVQNLTMGDVTYFYQTNNLQIARASFVGSSSVKGNNTFGYAVLSNNLSIEDNNTFDTLLLNNQGYQFTIAAGSSVVVNNKLAANASSGQNVFVHSSASGSPAALTCNGDTVCLEYMTFQDIDASASTVPVYAGQFSTDALGNSGINFTPCVLPFSDVWPGDANADGVVDNVDMLNIGLAYNEAGFTRAGADLSWGAQSSQDWNRIFNSFVNIKHADCDGNGSINADDTLAVSQNYSLTHAFVANNNFADNQRLANTPLFFAPASTNVLANQMVSVPINLGSQSIQAVDMYGIAYKLNYDNTKIVPGSINITYPSSWFTPNANRLPFAKNFFAMGRMDNAQSRTDLTNVSGQGTIAYLNFQVAATASGTILLDLTNIVGTDRNGNPITVTGNSTILNITGTVGLQTAPAEVEFMQVFPNPTEGNLQLSYTLAESKSVIVEIYDVLGSKVYSELLGSQPTGNHQTELQIETLPIGVYELIVTTGITKQVRRIVKTK